jgi:hypothetical protein
VRPSSPSQVLSSESIYTFSSFFRPEAVAPARPSPPSPVQTGLRSPTGQHGQPMESARSV